ncbi:MAG: acyl-CoA carboxylase subunit beta [Lachnospiraceae bacterium]|nr:acyl-CoA carboxylase subunit beta [Lachnospiraceae bacterium]
MDWKEANDKLSKRRERAALGGGQEKIEKQHRKGKMTARERLEYLFDKGSFVEIDAFIESRIDDFEMDRKRVPGDGVVVGYGKINGRTVFAASEDFTVIGGTLGEYHAAKICHIQDVAYENRCPILMINDSGGARIEEGICSLSGYSGIFLRNTRASGVIPQIAIIMGPCSGGACYSPALCDFIFMVRGTGQMFLTGPQVVKSVLHEETTIDELGGAQVHETRSGVAHFVCDSETQCMDEVKRLLAFLPDSCRQRPPEMLMESTKFAPFQRKKSDRCNELVSVVPPNSRKVYDVHEVIKRIVDDGSCMEIQERWAMNAVVCLARLDGRAVGIIANQPTQLAGALDCDASDKIARFIRTCDCFRIPLITLIDVPAFFPGKDQEYRGIIRHGAKILYAYSEAAVPKISLIMRKAYGGAYIAMNSKDMGADIVYAWPIAEIAVMGAEGATNIIFKKKIEASGQPEKERKRVRKEYSDKFMNPYIAAARGYITEVIFPEETRTRLISALDMLKNKQAPETEKRHGNMPL